MHELPSGTRPLTHIGSPYSTASAASRLRFEELLNRVALMRDEITIERQGRPMAVLMPIEVVERLRQWGAEAVRGPLAREDGPPISDEEAMALAVDYSANFVAPLRTRTWLGFTG